MSNGYFEVVGDIIHTVYVACRYEIKWNIQAISGEDNANGFIVQRFNRTAFPSLDYLKDTRYYEAWAVTNGICDENRVFDDGYNVYLYPSDRDQFQEELVEAIILSSGTSGRIIFKGDVFWIPIISQLYPQIAAWKKGEVKEAGDLLSARTFPPLDAEKPKCDHNFEHEWDFTDEDLIIDTAYRVFDSAFPKKVRDVNLKLCINAMNISNSSKKKLELKLGINR